MAIGERSGRAGGPSPVPISILSHHRTYGSVSRRFLKFAFWEDGGKQAAELVFTVTAGASAGTTFGGSSRKKKIFIGPNKEFELKINNIALQLPYATEGNVMPDIVVPITEAALREGRDEQLERALELLDE